MSIIGEKKKVANDTGEKRSSAMRVTQGSFSKVRHSSRTHPSNEEIWLANKWYFCREWFQQESQGVTRILYSHSKHQTEDVARFIRKVKNKLKIHYYHLVYKQLLNQINQGLLYLQVKIHMKITSHQCKCKMIKMLMLCYKDC